MFTFGTPSSSAAPSTSTPAPSFGGFGGFGQQNQNQQSQTPASSGGGGLFSSFASAPAASSAAPAFGSSTSTSSPFKPLGQSGTAPPASQPSLFGSLGQPQQQQQQQQQTAAPFSFGTSSTTQPQQQLSFGQQPQQQQQQQQQPLGQSTIQALNKNAKFEELSESERKALQDLDAIIQRGKAVEEDLKARDFGATIAKTAASLRDVSVEYTSLLSVLEQARSSSGDLRQRFQLDLEDICKAVRIVDHFKGNPSGQIVNQTTKGVVDGKFPFKFFKRKVEEMTDRIKVYQQTIEVLQGQVNTQQESDQVKAILPTLRAQHALTLSLASKLATMHDDLEEMKQVYAHLWRQRGSFSQLRDPFVEAGLNNSSTSYSALTSSQMQSLKLQ